MARKEKIIESLNEKTFKLVQQEAECGLPLGLYKLAFYYLKGRHIEKNENYAFKLFERACVKGVLNAETNLGKCYILGIGCEKNINLGIEKLISAGKKGDGNAYYTLAQLHLTNHYNLKDLSKVKLYLNQACQLGYAKAMFLLAFCYDINLFEDLDRSKQSVKFYKKAQKLLSRDAISMMASLQTYGMKCKQSIEKAKINYSRSIICANNKEIKSPIVNMNYAKALIDGISLDKNNKLALSYLKNINSSSGYSHYLTAKILEEENTEENQKLAIQEYEKSLEKGFESSALILAEKYINNDKEKDYIKALNVILNAKKIQNNSVVKSFLKSVSNKLNKIENEINISKIDFKYENCATYENERINEINSILNLCIKGDKNA